MENKINKLVLVNNKRKIAKILDEENNDRVWEVLTWDNYYCDDDKSYSHLEVMVNNVTWKECYISDDLPEREKDKLLYQCYKATIELCNWARAKYGEDKIAYPQINGEDQWWIIE